MDEIITTIYKDISSTSTGQLNLPFLSDSNSTTVNKGLKASFKAVVLYR